MYWGEEFVNLAWSDNLIDWYPSVDNNGELTPVIKTRPRQLDSRLTECGPPALIIDEGIVLLYNGKMQKMIALIRHFQKHYTVGRVIFDKMILSKYWVKIDACLIRPTFAHTK